MKKKLVLLGSSILLSSSVMAALPSEGTEVGAGYTWQNYDEQSIDAEGVVFNVEHRMGNGFFLEGSLTSVEFQDDYDGAESTSVSAGAGVILQELDNLNVLLSAGYASVDSDLGVDANGFYVKGGFEYELDYPGLVFDASYAITSLDVDGSNEVYESGDLSIEQAVNDNIKLVAGVTISEDATAPYIGAKYVF